MERLNAGSHTHVREGGIPPCSYLAPSTHIAMLAPQTQWRFSLIAEPLLHDHLTLATKHRPDGVRP
jgi:hypothetical protein